MKHIIFLVVVGLTVLSSCTGVKTVSKGLENQAFLEFVSSSNNYSGGVQVGVSDQTTFTAEVHKPHAKRPKGVAYAISSGTHVVTVTHNGQTLYSKKIFVGAQETKQISLP